MATIEYPEAISSISSDNMNLSLIGLGASGTVYRSNIGLQVQAAVQQNTSSTNNGMTSSWKIDDNPNCIRFSSDGNEIITSTDKQINIFDSESQTNIKNIFINKQCVFFFSVLDCWNISQVNQPIRFRPIRFLPSRLRPIRSRSMRSRPMRFRPMRFRPIRFQPIRFQPIRFLLERIWSNEKQKFTNCKIESFTIK